MLRQCLKHGFNKDPKKHYLDLSFFLPVIHKISNLIIPTLKTRSQSKEVAVIMFFHFTLDITLVFSVTL